MLFQKLTVSIALLLISLLPGCGREQAEEPASDETPPEISRTTTARPGCQSCHPYSLAQNHSERSCISCHNGDNRTADLGDAHIDLISHPASPANMDTKCGGCHQETATVAASRHYTLSNAVNLVRRHFGADRDLASLLEIPVTDRPTTALELADDLLRRRCLRCHVYYEGDEYSQVEHGTGCAACHLEYEDGKPVTHEFLALPTDSRCLSCHYANRVGSDYYGHFDHDFKLEYRTPYQPEGYYPARPYAVEQHRLIPDIHQSAGMTCIDCHFEMHGGKTMKTLGCAACHLHRNLPAAAKHLSIEDGELIVTTRQGKRKIVVPRATDPVHGRYEDTVACTVCHAQWSYNDQETNLVRIDHEEYEEWDELYVQDSSEVEVLLLNGIYGDQILEPVMTDKISGLEKPGLWLKGFKIRRWAAPLIDFDREGRLQVMRPLLDLHISWVNARQETVFDSVAGESETLRPFTPHTIGKAGAFYHQRISKLFPREPSQAGQKE